MYLCYVMFITLPLGTYVLLSKELAPMEYLPFPCWSPIPLETWWGFTATYVFESIFMAVVFTSYTYLQVYMTAVTISIVYQMKLIGKAFLSMEERVRQILESRILENIDGRREGFLIEMKGELRNCLRNFQQLHR